MLPHELATAALYDSARPDAVRRQHGRGKRTARERIALLVDDGSFREIGALARPDEPGPDGQPILADGIIIGTARIDERPVVVVATDFMSAGGSNGLIGNEKQRRAMEIAATRGHPLVMLFDGGGHRIHEGLDARDFAGGFDIQQAQTRLSGWVPMVAAILGPGYGQPTIAASLCDYVVAVRGIASLGMAPPALVRAATGETTDADVLNGPDAQASYGTIDAAVDTEEEALEALRWYLDLLPSNAEAELPREVPALPRADAARSLDDAVPANLRVGYDMSEVVAGIVDDDSVVALKSAFAPNLLTALARIEGRPIGIIANQPLSKAGMLDAAAADKAARLVSLCDAFGLPILVLMDLPGMAVGAEAEQSGLARSSARLSLELGAATVPTFTVVVRKGYGGGYVMMSGGRTFHPELVVAWPHAETAVMAVETAVELVFQRDLAAAPDPAGRRTELIEQYRGQLGAVRGAEGFGYDAVIRPSKTRDWLADLLAVLPRHRLMDTFTPRRHSVAPL
ncbi:carboxyl transferase domain-containing protein [Nocardioides sp. WS12]|uniref:acyl-CoA carboxylase subunit beta n=1 Tax=Nocardioides sp. WS12 TaxID=2486272 RepID=UPI0015F8506A|nr:carboxyl transferase domain-containing protein [Nocardioides sp. WS12]